MLPVPVSSTGFSKLWVRIFGRATKELVSPLIDSLLCELPHMQPGASIRGLIRFGSFEQMVAETLRRDDPLPAKSARRLAHDDSVRSIQRLPTVSLDCHQISDEFLKWVPGVFPWFLSTTLMGQSRGVEFRMRPFRQPLLLLETVAETFSVDRVKFNIVGGLLSRTQDTGWLEFRQVANRRYTLASVNEFIPRLPWLIYLLTQAPVHALVMWMFGRHLQRIGSGTGAIP